MKTSSTACADRTRNRQRGLTESAQWAVLIPLLLATVFLLIQAAIYFHGRSIAQEAAMVGAEEAAMFGAKAGSTSTAAEFAARGGLTDVVVSQDSTNELVTVRVTARVPALLTRDLPLVSGSAQRPKEA